MIVYVTIKTWFDIGLGWFDISRGDLELEWDLFSILSCHDSFFLSFFLSIGSTRRARSFYHWTKRTSCKCLHPLSTPTKLSYWINALSLHAKLLSSSPNTQLYKSSVQAAYHNPKCLSCLHRWLLLPGFCGWRYQLGTYIQQPLLAIAIIKESRKKSGDSMKSDKVCVRRWLGC